MAPDPTDAAPAPRDSAVPGGDRLIGGRYRLLSHLGRGGMGIVWAARDELLNRDVAVKEVIPPMGVDDRERAALRERTMREARTAARITSGGAVTIFDVVEEDARPWIVMEQLPPRTLDDVLREGGPLAPVDAARIGVAVLDALTSAHAAGVLHRDVKPSNVMFREDGRAVLGDFGIAHFDGDSTLTSTGMVMGSPAYVAPERAHGTPATPASDLWSLGATLWAAVEGRSPFQRDNALASLSAVLTEDPPPAPRSGPLQPVLDGLLHKDPAHRLDAGTARSMLAAVASPGDHVVPVAPPLETTRALPVVPVRTDDDVRHGAAPLVGERDGDVEGRRRPWLLPLLAALLILGLVGAALALNGLGDDPGDRTATPGSTTPAVTETTAGTPTTPAQETSEPAPTTSVPEATTTAPPETTAPPPAEEDSEAEVPEGFEMYTDPSGFSVAVPEGWQPERDGPRVRLRDPNSAAFLLVDQTDDPAGDPVEDWQRQEQSVSQRLDNYERIGEIRAVDYRGWDAADWEFVFGENQGTHVLNRNVVTSPDQAYALYWSVPSSQWDERRKTFDQIAASFQPDS